MDRVVDLTQQLISLPSITPSDKGCQRLLQHPLRAMGFTCKSLPYGNVENLWAIRGETGPLFVFAGHTDVVSVGELSQWLSNPFQAEIRENKLFGRGAADMKGNLAAMICACEMFLSAYPQANCRLGFLLTSGEEGHDFMDGTPKVMEYLANNGITIDYCLVGEPSCQNQLGDTIRHGRRGSLSGFLTIHGQQGHVAYLDPADNCVHQAGAVIAELANTKWDNGNQHFPATSFHITEIHAGDGSSNVVPAQLTMQFNLRYCTESSATTLQQRVESILHKHDIHFDLRWRDSGAPFLTAQGELLRATQRAIEKITGLTPSLSTGGGTSDARFIAPYGVEVIEFGVCSSTIHQANEYVAVDELQQLVKIYYQVLAELISGSALIKSTDPIIS